MHRSHALLLATIAAGALIGACSAGTDSTSLIGSKYVPTGNGDTTTGSSSGGSSSGSSSGGSSSGSSSSGSSSGGGLPTQAPPDAGPGSTTSQAHQYFDSTVYPLLNVCQACHSTGTDGAPEMMDSPADKTYSELDALGLIVTNSQILSQGSHDTGKAPALTSAQQSAITQWLALEAQERVGTAAPVNVMDAIGACASKSDWDAIGWTNLRTQKRTDENANKCTACDNSLCASCHSGGDQGFFMAEGSAFDDGDTSFVQTFQAQCPDMLTYINKFFGLNGTSPVASNAIANKAAAVALGPAYSHPMFVIPPSVQTGITTFVNDALTAYTNHTCTAPTDGGAPPSDDAGP